MKYIASEGDVLDRICWKYYGKTVGVVEQVLNANKGLAEYGAFIPMGLVIELPDLAVESVSTTITLWS